MFALVIPAKQHRELETSALKAGFPLRACGNDDRGGAILFFKNRLLRIILT